MPESTIGAKAVGASYHIVNVPGKLGVLGGNVLAKSLDPETTTVTLSKSDKGTWEIKLDESALANETAASAVQQELADGTHGVAVFILGPDKGSESTDCIWTAFAGLPGSGGQGDYMTEDGVEVHEHEKDKYAGQKLYEIGEYAELKLDLDESKITRGDEGKPTAIQMTLAQAMDHFREEVSIKVPDAPSIH